MKRTLAVAVLLAIGLVGCSGPPAPEPSDPPETPDVPVASSLIVSAENMSVLADDDTEIASYNYFEPDAANAVADLTFFFGFRPELTEQEAAPDFPATTVHDWGGLELYEYHDVTPSFPEVNSFTVVLKAAEVGGVALSAIGGVAVGAEEVAAAPLAFRHDPNKGGTNSIDLYYLDETPVEISGEADAEPAALSVILWVTGRFPLVSHIEAPHRNWAA